MRENTSDRNTADSSCLQLGFLLRFLQSGLQVLDVLGNTAMTTRSLKNSIKRREEEGGHAFSGIALNDSI